MKFNPDLAAGRPRGGAGGGRRAWVSVGLVALTAAIYAQTAHFGFLDYDDNILVTANRHVSGGLSWRGLSWAFGATSGASFWHPLTWLSHMADVELFGLEPGGHHLMSAGIHALGAALLFLALARLTGSTWRSAFAAALFAVHPLHVESVAWISERKDVLSAMFCFLALLAYAGYARRPRPGRYALTALFFAMALMSKPMALTLPFLFLLLDWWPLGRAVRPASPGRGRGAPAAVAWRRLVVEKIPMFLMAAGSAYVTLQYRGEDVWLQPLESYPLSIRLANAAAAYGTYLWKTAFPASLAAYYPHPASLSGHIPAWLLAASVLALAAASWAAVRLSGRRPGILVGWLWYLGALFPVIGLVQVGEQALADRFTYIPLIGIFLAVAWGVPAARGGAPVRRLGPGVAAAAALLALTLAARGQAAYWRDDVALFSHAAAVTEGNWNALNNLGAAYDKRGEHGKAVACYREALRIDPKYATAWNNLGVALLNLGDSAQAAACHREALRLRPNYAKAWNNLGVDYGESGNFREAAGYFAQAVRVRPDYADAWCNLGVAYENLGMPREAVACYREALRVDPGNAEAARRLARGGDKAANSR